MKFTAGRLDRLLEQLRENARKASSPDDYLDGFLAGAERFVRSVEHREIVGNGYFSLDDVRRTVANVREEMRAYARAV